MLKVSFFSGQGQEGPRVIPLFGPADSVFEKVASVSLLPEVSSYIEGLRPRNDSQYVLVNAMGASEYYGSNVNGDHFPEAALIHKPDDWKNNHALDSIRSQDWAYGFPTFYNAQVFAHHRNKDATKGFGGVELAAWNPHMRRVELVTRLDRDKCLAHGGSGTWDKLKAGEFPDVSMGTKVPYDTCSICLDWDKYEEAKGTFEEGRHKHPGDAILEFHKRLKEQGGRGIRGLSITRKDYCDHARYQMNKILPDGRKVWVYNDFPRFFDISYVFIGADKIAKAMLKIAGEGRNYMAKTASVFITKGSAEMAEELGLEEKIAAIATFDQLKNWNKTSEMSKEVLPSQFASKAVPILNQNEPDLPPELLQFLASLPLEKALSTLSAVGIVLRPSEFQDMVMRQLGQGDLASEYAASNTVFPQTAETEEMAMPKTAFSAALAQRLFPYMASRSALGPYVEKRAAFYSTAPSQPRVVPSSHPSDLLRKIGAAYNGYRHGLMQLIPSSQELIDKAAGASDVEFQKIATLDVEKVFTPLSYQYLKTAFSQEYGVGDTVTAVVKIGYFRREPACRGDSP